MVSTKAQQILDRVRKHLKSKRLKSDQSHQFQNLEKADQRTPVNQDKTDPLFPNSADSGSEAKLPITGPEQGMLSTRLR